MGEDNTVCYAVCLPFNANNIFMASYILGELHGFYFAAIQILQCIIISW